MGTETVVEGVVERITFETIRFPGDQTVRLAPEQTAMTVRFDDRDLALMRPIWTHCASSTHAPLTSRRAASIPPSLLPLLTTHFVMLSRNLLYTAVTRGKRPVVLVCDPRAAELALSERPKGPPADAFCDPTCRAAGVKRPSLTYVVTTARL